MEENLQAGERPVIDLGDVLKERVIEGQPLVVTGKRVGRYGQLKPKPGNWPRLKHSRRMAV